MRSSVLDERYADYLTTARAKGLRDDLVLRRHALPNALLPSHDAVLPEPRLRDLRRDHGGDRVLAGRVSGG